MSTPGKGRIVVLGVMSRHPVAGVIWQTLHYVDGLRRMGYDVHYVEAGAYQPSSMLVAGGNGDRGDDRTAAAAAFLDGVLRPVGLGDRWAFHALHSDGRVYGMSDSALREVYRSADLVLNLHGSTLPRPEHTETGALVYLETDPVHLQIELDEGTSATIEYLRPHRAFFTFGENLGTPACPLPVSDRFPFRPTRQPVVLDYWDGDDVAPGPRYTTVGNWKQTWRDVEFRGEIYRWSKHHEFLKFLELPSRAGSRFELALSPRGCGAEERSALEAAGWRVRDALELSRDPEAYRGYIRASRGEFTVAKDQNVRLRTGWFSDRSATYLAAGRPVITQDTGFGEILPIGEGLFPFTRLDEIEAAVDAIESDYARHSAAAREIAREYFAHDVVLERLLAEVGVR